MAFNANILANFEPISLEEMGKVKLMNRVDSKFVAHIDKINELLEMAAPDYFIQEIEGKRCMPYFTRYFDTSDTDMFYQHQRGKKVRQKVRLRVYETTANLPFLEIKSKNNKGRTKKKRVEMETGDELLNYSEFLENNCRYESNSLTPQIENHFYRITLVNKELTERITIDTDIEFHNLQTGCSKKLPSIGIVEWKRDGISGKSGMGMLLRKLHIHQSGFSKYCIGMALTDPSLKQNRLKERLRKINKIEEH
ncbi:MAG: polyphosphate polymerase domain-containing protein [Muribaculaceae bacterium]|nr:polyphosphate polymerase domain-containing protein [Muribaculaceae bacterium]